MTTTAPGTTTGNIGRALARAALRVNSGLSHAEVARQLGLAEAFVASVCLSETPRCPHGAAGSVSQPVTGMAKRELIKAALLESPDDSHSKIAKRLSVSHMTVSAVCDEEVARLATSCTHGLTGQGARTDRKPVPRPEISEADLLARNAVST